MRQHFLFLVALSFVFTPATLAQGGPGNSGVWASRGHNTVDSNSGGRGVLGGNPGFTPTQNNSPTPTVSSIDVIYDEEDKFEKLKITGSNFSPYKEKINITIEGSRLSVQTADPHLIVATLPPGLKDKPKVSLEMNGRLVLKNKEIKLLPRVSGISLMSGPPGTPMTIYGTHFAHRLSDNKVSVGGVDAPVIGGTKDSLTVLIPQSFEGRSPTWGVPVQVTVDGKSSNTDIDINIQSRVF